MEKLTLLDRIDRVPEYFKQAAEAMNALEVQDFAFYGGAVRDMIAGRQPNDIDVCALLPRDNGFWTDFQTEARRGPKISSTSRSGAFTTTTLKSMFGDKGFRLTEVSQNDQGRLTAKLACCDYSQSEPVILDLNFNTLSDTHLPLVQAEAPINAGLMMPDMRLFGEVETLDHIGRDVYAMREGISTLNALKSLVRYAKLQSKIPSLSLKAPSDRLRLVSAWQSAQRVTGMPHRLAASMLKKRHSVVHMDI